MKQLKLITKKQANNLILDSLFKSPKTLSISNWCTGKYQKPSDPDATFNVSDDVVAIFAQRQSDKHGAYYKIKCLR
jgi:hypothetical protein